jgi:hypothetical protein
MPRPLQVADARQRQLIGPSTSAAIQSWLGGEAAAGEAQRAGRRAEVRRARMRRPLARQTDPFY